MVQWTILQFQILVGVFVVHVETDQPAWHGGAVLILVWLSFAYYTSCM